MTIYLFLALVFAVAVAVFAVSNTDTVTVNLIFQQLRASLAMVIIGSATLGALAVGVLSGVRQLGLRYKVWDKEGRSRRLEEDAAKWREKAEGLEEEVTRLEDELIEAEAYASHLEELLKEYEERSGQAAEAKLDDRASADEGETPSQ